MKRSELHQVIGCLVSLGHSHLAKKFLSSLDSGEKALSNKDSVTSAFHLVLKEGQSVMKLNDTMAIMMALKLPRPYNQFATFPKKGEDKALKAAQNRYYIAKYMYEGIKELLIKNKKVSEKEVKLRQKDLKEAELGMFKVDHDASTKSGWGNTTVNLDGDTGVGWTDTTATDISDTEKRVLKSLHLRGMMGKVGALTKKQRLALLKGLIKKGFLDKNGNVTQKGIKVSVH